MGLYVIDDDSNESPHTGHPGLCEQCQHSTCFALHDYSAKSCPFQTCDECAELEVLDSEIMEVHNLLVNLSIKRRALKSRINSRHDRLVYCLPVEVVSIIFCHVAESETLRYVKSHSSYEWNPCLILGAVCQRWREITLPTPQLWAQVTIDPWKHAFMPDITAQWISRSCALPLSLTIKEIKRPSSTESSSTEHLANLMQLLRSNVGRWKDLDLEVPWRINYELLNGLEDVIHLDTLQLDSPFDIDDEAIPISMKNPIIPKSLKVKHTNLAKVPLQWDILSHLEAHLISVDTLVHIFRHATNLQSCIANATKWDQHLYPIPASPVLSNLKTLETRGYNPELDILHHLVLPSLESLKYTLPMETNRNVLPTLADFLGRSKPCLKTFFFHYGVYNPENLDWYHMFPTITHLAFKIDLPSIQVEFIEECIQGLGAYIKPLPFPNLQALAVTTTVTSPKFWFLLGGIFPDKIIDEVPEVIRPLKLLKINLSTNWDGEEELMDAASCYRLHDIRGSGVEVVTYDDNNDDLMDPLFDDYAEDEDVVLNNDNDNGDGSRRNSESTATKKSVGVS